MLYDPGLRCPMRFNRFACQQSSPFDLPCTTGNGKSSNAVSQISLRTLLYKPACAVVCEACVLLALQHTFHLMFVLVDLFHGLKLSILALLPPVLPTLKHKDIMIAKIFECDPCTDRTIFIKIRREIKI